MTTQNTDDEVAERVNTEWDGIWIVLGCKWTFHIIRYLAIKEDGDGFNQIGRVIDGIAASTLSDRLGLLQKECLVSRTVVDGSPPGVNYSLTKKGRELAAIIDDIDDLDSRYA